MSDPKKYAIGWIYAIHPEYIAAFLDEGHEPPDSLDPQDGNNYTLGRIGKHNVVIATLPLGEYGLTSVARDMIRSFPSIRIGLMVGIGGGVPSPKHDIRLGDIVVRIPGNGQGGVFQYDYGRTTQDQTFTHTGFLSQPPQALCVAVSGLRAKHELDGHGIEDAIDGVLGMRPRLRRVYSRPNRSTDRLYASNVVHPQDNYRPVL